MIHKIKALYDSGEGLKIRAIARQLGLSRTTVKKYLKQEETVTEQQQTVRRRRQRLDGQRDYPIEPTLCFLEYSAQDDIPIVFSELSWIFRSVTNSCR